MQPLSSDQTNGVVNSLNSQVNTLLQNYGTDGTWYLSFDYLLGTAKTTAQALKADINGPATEGGLGIKASLADSAAGAQLDPDLADQWYIRAKRDEQALQDLPGWREGMNLTVDQIIGRKPDNYLGNSLTDIATKSVSAATTVTGNLAGKISTSVIGGALKSIPWYIYAGTAAVILLVGGLAVFRVTRS